MDKVREANASLSFLRDKGKPFERVGRKATGLNPSIIVEAWQRGCRADQHLQFAGSSTVKISRPGYEVLIWLTNNTKFVTPLPKVPNSCFATFLLPFFLGPTLKQHN